MKRYQNIFIALLASHIPIVPIKPYKAVTIVPIADAVGSPIKTFFPEKTTVQAYTQLPLCGGIPLASSCCPRLHQILFNEMGTVIKEEGQEVLIKISNCFYQTHSSTIPQHSYWTLKKNIIPIATLEQKGVTIDRFPPPISFEDAKTVVNERVATLAKPWSDTESGHTFSAGTRFLKTHEQESDTRVFLFNVEKNNFTLATIPSSYIIETTATTTQKKLDLFIKILKSWAHIYNGSIPYVWGGCSFTATTNDAFSEIRDTHCSFYEIQTLTFVPKPGLDCSNLILRAAQLAGIPFFFKNSHTITAYLKTLNPNEPLAAGDIIWIPGHVLVVADIEKNTLIEARGYKYKGQGKIQEIALNKVFKKINSFADLVAAWNAKQSIERLGDDGSIIETVKSFKLLSMRSIMEL